MNQAEDNYNAVKGAVILAGGDSKRLGSPKALLDIQGQTLIELMVERLGLYFKQVTVVTDRPGLYTNLPVLLTADLLADQQKSPLRGIHAGLSASDFPYQFVVACDMPFLNLNLIAYMSRFASDYDAVVPRINNYFQPLYAYYSRSCIAVIENQLKQGCYKVTGFYTNLKIRYIGEEEIMRFDPDQQSFININTWADYKTALKILAKSLKAD